MKIVLFFFLCPLLLFSQVQIGQDIDGENQLDWAGTSVSISADGSIVAIGSPNWRFENTEPGNVRILKNQSSVWTQIGQTIYGYTINNEAGKSVGLSADGTIVALGSSAQDYNGEGFGRIRVFQYIDESWVQIGQDINGSEGDSFDRLSLSSDGSIIVISSPYNNENGEGSGHVKVFKNQGNVWTQIGEDINGEAPIMDPFGDYIHDFFGRSTSLSSDGHTMAINSSGDIHIYNYQDEIWENIGIIITNTQTCGLSISPDGSTLALGLCIIDNESRGITRVYENQGGAIWAQIGSDIVGEGNNDRSGYATSLSSDGSFLAIGAIFNEGINGQLSGHVRIFKNIDNSWTQIGQDIDGEYGGNRFGESVSLTPDAATLVVGAPRNSESAPLAGHARVFDLSQILSINELSKRGFKLVPNPTNDTFQVLLTDHSSFKGLYIFSTFGQLLMFSNKVHVNIESLSSGVYYVKIKTNIGTSVQKLIVQ